MGHEEPAAKTVSLLREASHVVVLTGAGMSQESGVPTFRDALTGLWAKYDPEELATPDAFRRDPVLVLNWYVSRYRRVLEVEPHVGHHALVRLRAHFKSFTIITQNVDGLHQRAGLSAVLELHGALDRFRCVDAAHPYDMLPLARSGATVEEVPRCGWCGAMIRPGVVWFGETLPERTLAAAWKAVEDADALVVIGTSAVVYPAAELPHVARARSVKVVEINPERTPLSPLADVSWCASAGQALTTLVGALDGNEHG